MKKFIALFLLFVSAACFGNNQHDHKKQAQEDYAMISIPTIQCQVCVERIQAAVKKVEGVKSVSIDLNSPHCMPAKQHAGEGG